MPFASRHFHRGTWVQLVICEDEIDLGDLFIIMEDGSLVNLSSGVCRAQNDRERFDEIGKTLMWEK